MHDKVVYIVHCIDTEGPLHESLLGTQQRLKELFDLDIELNEHVLKKLQDSKINLNGLESSVARVLSPNLLNYLDTWGRIDEVLSLIMSDNIRKILTDSFGGGWVYNWFCMDHVGFKNNPRGRDLGHHVVFDHYNNILKSSINSDDKIFFHHHPVGFKRDAHKSTTNYLSFDPLIFKILSRKIIDRMWFPSVYRPGFHVTRPDSHWFLEQYIPFEYANQSSESVSDESFQNDSSGGRFGDWRKATTSWVPYRPSHDDYQKKGSCRRNIARCLNIGTRIRILTQEDVDKAFYEANEGGNPILSFTNHDFRDMTMDLSDIKKQIKKANDKYPEVLFRYCDSREAFRLSLNLKKTEMLDFDIQLKGNKLFVRSNHETFGPQPFLAIKTKKNDYFHDNFDFQETFREWTYTFDSTNFLIQDIEKIGVSSSDSYGNVCVIVYNVEDKLFSKKMF
jgi:hypothetical protein